MTSRRDNNMAIPLCLPNNCQWNARTGEYIQTGEKRSSLYVVDEALQKLRTVRGKHCWLSRTKGKYFLYIYCHIYFELFTIFQLFVFAIEFVLKKFFQSQSSFLPYKREKFLSLNLICDVIFSWPNSGSLSSMFFKALSCIAVTCKNDFN